MERSFLFSFFRAYRKEIIWYDQPSDLPQSAQRFVGQTKNGKDGDLRRIKILIKWASLFSDPSLEMA